MEDGYAMHRGSGKCGWDRNGTVQGMRTYKVTQGDTGWVCMDMGFGDNGRMGMRVSYSNVVYVM
jgi:hypothetical protein